jgi:hypothetical protein
MVANPAPTPQILQGIKQQATVAAYSDLFFIIAVVSTITAIILSINYAYYRYKKLNPLAKELAALAKMREGKEAK